MICKSVPHTCGQGHSQDRVHVRHDSIYAPWFDVPTLDSTVDFVSRNKVGHAFWAAKRAVSVKSDVHNFWPAERPTSIWSCRTRPSRSRTWCGTDTWPAPDGNARLPACPVSLSDTDTIKTENLFSPKRWNSYLSVCLSVCLSTCLSTSVWHRYNQDLSTLLAKISVTKEMKFLSVSVCLSVCLSLSVDLTKGWYLNRQLLLLLQRPYICFCQPVRHPLRPSVCVYAPSVDS